MTNMIERVARAIARANGDEFANAFKSKDRWIAKRGMSGGRFRDVNEPTQVDYLDMAEAAIKAMREPTDEMVTAGFLLCDEEGTRIIWTDMIDAALTQKIEE